MMSNDFHHRCVACNAVPEARQVFQCPNKHIMCIVCGLKNGRVCKVDKADVIVTSNPINTNPDAEAVINSKVCPHSKSGCQWGFRTVAEMQEHAIECKYRPYTCIGNAFNIWNCDWTGTQEQFVEHTNQAHPHLREHLKYWHSSAVPFSPTKTIRMLKLIDAFNKTFLFFYNCDGDRDAVTFAICSLGRKCDADRYLIDFEVRKDQRKIKFLEQCHPDSEEFLESIRNGYAFTMAKKSIESLVDNNEINYRFIIKRKDVVATENVIKEEYLKNHILANPPTKASQPTAPAKETQLLNEIKAIWNNNSMTGDTIPSPSSIKGDVKKVVVESPKEFVMNVNREYEPTESANRSKKMNMSTLVDIMESLNLRRGTGNGDSNQQQQQQQPFHSMPYGSKLMKKRYPMNSGAGPSSSMSSPHGFIRK